MAQSIGVKRDWIFLGVIYRSELNKKHKESYENAHIYVSTDGKYIKAHLISNWTSSYNTTEELNVEHYGGSVFNAIRFYTKD